MKTLRDKILIVASLAVLVLAGQAMAVNKNGFRNGGATMHVPAQNTLNPQRPLDLTLSAHTGIATSSVWSPVVIDLATTTTWLEGNITELPVIDIKAPTWAFAAASTVTGGATMKIDRCPLAGANATILFCTNVLLGTVGGNQVNADTNMGLMIVPSGITDGVGNVSKRAGLFISGPPGGNIDLGNQTANLTDLYGLEIDLGTLTSDTNTRTVVNTPAGLKVKAPLAGSNVTFTNKAFALWSVDAAKFDGGVAINTSTVVTDFDLHDPSATTTMQITSGGAGLGGRMVVEDVDGAGCTEITALNGAVSAKTITCP